MGSEHKSGLKILIAFLILNLVLICYNIGIGVYASRETMEYKLYSKVEAIQLYNYIDAYQSSIHCKALTREEIKKEIQKIVKPKFYIERNIDSRGARTYPAFRIIEIDCKSYGYDYAYALIHEYIHLDYFLSDESLVDYLSVKLLWESEVPYLKKSACWLVKDKIANDNGSEYDCTAQLIEYFSI